MNTVPTLGFPNNHAAAIAVRDFGALACARVQGLTLLPYNFNKPEFTVWWLVPGPQPSNPAYRHGKCFFSQLGRGPAADNAYVGFYVEKGFAQAEAKALQRPLVELMDNSWRWHAVVASGRAGELDGRIDAMLAASQVPVIFTVSASEPNTPADSTRAADELTFEATGTGGLRLESGAGSVLLPLESSETVRELFARLTELNDLRFYWVDVLVGVRLRYGTAGTPGAWGAEDVWHKTMAPWVNWLR